MSSNEKKYSTCSSICDGLYQEGFSLELDIDKSGRRGIYDTISQAFLVFKYLYRIK